MLVKALKNRPRLSAVVRLHISGEFWGSPETSEPAGCANTAAGSDQPAALELTMAEADTTPVVAPGDPFADI
jgi:hypothetical protein